MRLSDAILMGDSLKKHDATQWLSRDGSCGCAFGGALLAVGIGEEFNLERKRQWDSTPNNFDCVRRTWPWLTNEHLVEITRLHKQLVIGDATIEQIAAYVRSIEPAEPDAPTCDICKEPAESLFYSEISDSNLCGECFDRVEEELHGSRTA